MKRKGCWSKQSWSFLKGPSFMFTPLVQTGIGLGGSCILRVVYKTSPGNGDIITIPAFERMEFPTNPVNTDEALGVIHRGSVTGRKWVSTIATISASNS